jgi:hypothetical protein
VNVLLCCLIKKFEKLGLREKDLLVFGNGGNRRDKLFGRWVHEWLPKNNVRLILPDERTQEGKGSKCAPAHILPALHLLSTMVNAGCFRLRVEGGAIVPFELGSNAPIP